MNAVHPLEAYPELRLLKHPLSDGGGSVLSLGTPTLGEETPSLMSLGASCPGEDHGCVLGCPQSEEGNPSALKGTISRGVGVIVLLALRNHPASDLPQPLSVSFCPKSNRAHLALQDSTLNSGPGVSRDCMGLGSCVSKKPLQPLLVRSTQGGCDQALTSCVTSTLE